MSVENYAWTDIDSWHCQFIYTRIIGYVELWKKLYMNDMGDIWTGEVYRLTGCYVYYYDYEREIVLLQYYGREDGWDLKI